MLLKRPVPCRTGCVVCACRGFNVEGEVVVCGAGAGFKGREWRGCGGVHVGSVGVLCGEVWLVVCV